MSVAKFPQFNMIESLEPRTLLAWIPHPLTVTVFRDLDRDGSRDANENGMTGWAVYLDNHWDVDGKLITASAITNSQGNATFNPYYETTATWPGSVSVQVGRSSRYWCTNQIVANSHYQLEHSWSPPATAAPGNVSFAMADTIVAAGYITNNFMMTDGGGAVSSTPLALRRVYDDINRNGAFDSSSEPSTLTNLSGQYAIKLKAGGHSLRVDPGADFAAVRGTSDARTVTIDFASGRSLKSQTRAPDFSLRMIKSAFVNVAIGYTSAAAGVRDNAQMLEEVRSLVAAANKPYANSSTNVMLNLVRVQRTSYVESGNISTDLDRIAAPRDTFADDLLVMRDRFAADVTMLLTSERRMSDNTIGLAFEYQRGGGNRAMAVVALQNRDADDALTLAHEIGHTLGAGHDAANTRGAGPASYSHGIRFRGDDGKFYKDVMAYGSAGVLPFFSTPHFRYAGHALGDSTADNARIIEETAPAVARYR